MHFDLSTTIATGFICFVLGFISHMFFDKKEVTMEKQIAILILVSWLSFAMIAYLQERELSFFFNAAGMGAVGNLLGIKTAELLGGIMKRK